MDSRWTRVEDGLPQHGEIVFTWNSKKEMRLCKYLFMRASVFSSKKIGTFVNIMSKFGRSDEHVTHFMRALPEPPNDEQN